MSKRELPQGDSESEKRQKGECAGGRIKKFANVEDYNNYMKQGNGFARGYLPRFRKADSLKDIDLPYGPRGMDPDTFPGPAETCDACPLDLTAPCSKRELVHCKELADLAIKEYNDESNFHKYELLKIEKVNFRETASSEYFMTVKVKNLTLGTVVETFQIHADHWGTFYKGVVSCLPKGGALPSPT
ncbi:hypothetical protein P3L10_031766 [Capsicum annuum]